MTISREKLKLQYAERRERRRVVVGAYVRACKFDLCRRPPFVKERSLRRVRELGRLEVVAAHPKGALYRAAEHQILLGRIRRNVFVAELD